MQLLKCQCGHVLYFENTRCLKCGHAVGFDLGSRSMLYADGESDFQLCGNGVAWGVCNWLVPKLGKHGAPNAAATQCAACRLNRTLPDLRVARNVPLWGKVEAAKRRLLVTLDKLGIDLPSKASDPELGLAFDIVSSRADPEVTMGHLQGVITVDLEEADDTFRQINQQTLGEDSRTLLGHFRHESGHYIWARWQNSLRFDDPQRLAFRQTFGDERSDYGVALTRHYEQGPVAGWRGNFITAYASSHPWEDWAETWNHYLQIVDGLETAEGLGLDPDDATFRVVHLPPVAGQLPFMLAQSAGDDAAFLEWLHRWASLSTMLNEIAQSMGQPPLSPYVLSTRVAQKLRLIHWLIGQAGRF